ncbi:MAG: restriction endonuclease S subunit [Polaribacter sp.]|jgi:restriction endonuclease S subunit
MQPNLSIGDLKKRRIPITSIEGQKVISRQIEELSKKSILQKAFTGELTSPERTIMNKDGSIPSEKSQANPERV